MSHFHLLALLSRHPRLKRLTQMGFIYLTRDATTKTTYEPMRPSFDDDGDGSHSAPKGSKSTGETPIYTTMR